MRGGEVLGEFQTLVNPHEAIPPFIAVLTGITNAMVGRRPAIDTALPAFLEFARGSVLVAHNAPFDVGFLKHFAARLGHPWPAFEVLDTAKLARRVITRDDAPNCKLSSLARLFSSSTTPNHRALSDARATVDVLHGLMERLGGLGVHTLEELATFTSRVSPAQRRKRHLAEQLPHAPGVYLFRDPATGCSTSAPPGTCAPASAPTSPPPRRAPGWARWSASPTSVTGIACATPLEAEVRELRLIAEHKPRYNRRSRFPEKVHWVKLTVEPGRGFPGASGARDRRRGRLPRPVLLAHDGREVPGGPARGVPGPPVQRPTPPSADPRPASSPRWTAASPPATAASTDAYAPGRRPARQPGAPPRRGRRGLTGRMARWRAERYEEATSTATG